MKKALIFFVVCALALVTGYIVQKNLTPKMAISSAMSLNYANLEHLERKSKLILTGRVIKRETQPSMGGENNQVVRDAITKSTVEISHIFQNDSNDTFAVGDKISVFEPAGIVQTGLIKTYFSTDGYQLMKDDAIYLLFLSEGVEDGDWAVNSYQGKYRMDQIDTIEDNFFSGLDKEKYHLLRKEVFAKYKSL